MIVRKTKHTQETKPLQTDRARKEDTGEANPQYQLSYTKTHPFDMSWVSKEVNLFATHDHGRWGGLQMDKCTEDLFYWAPLGTRKTENGIKMEVYRVVPMHWLFKAQLKC